MTFSVTKPHSTPLFEDYNPQSEIDTLMSLMKGCTISHEEPEFYTYPLNRIQALVLLRCESYSREKDEAHFYQLIHALLSYVICMNKQKDEPVPALFTQEFVKSILDPTARLDIELKSRVRVYRTNGASSTHETHEEWKCLLKVVTILASTTTNQPLSFFVKILANYKQYANPNPDELGFALCRLAEVMFCLGSQEENLELLHRERFKLLEEFCAKETDPKIKLFLLSMVLKEDSTHPMKKDPLQIRWVDSLRNFEADFLVRLVVDESFPVNERESLIYFCEGAVHTTASKELADRIKTALILQKVPLDDFLNKRTIAPYLECLEQVLLGKKYQRFCDLSPQLLQANFLLLLAGSATEQYSHCLTLLLRALPYCVHHLVGICSNELTASLSGSEDDIMLALRGRIEAFLDQNQPQEPLLNDGWLTVNDVLRYIASSQDEEPLELLKKSLLTWKTLADPDSKTVALAIRVCADFANGLTHLEESVQGIAYNLLDSLLQDDERQLKRIQSAEQLNPLFMIRVFFWVLNGYAETPLDGKNPSWTESLEGQELEIFACMANSTRAKKQTSTTLFKHYTRNNASPKSLLLACKIAPSLTGGQLQKLVVRLQEPQLSLLIEELNSPIFPENSKSDLFWYFYKQNTVSSLLLASRMYKVMGLSRLMLLLKALDKLETYSIDENKVHKELLKCLVHSSWACDTEITLYTSEDPKSIELVGLICKLANRFWLEAEITDEFCRNKIRTMVGEVIRAKQRSPSPQPELLSRVLKYNVFRPLIAQNKVTQEALQITDIGTNTSPGSPDPLDKN